MPTQQPITQHPAPLSDTAIARQGGSLNQAAPRIVYCVTILKIHIFDIIFEQVEKQRDRLPQTRAKGEDEMNNTIKTLQHKENKLAGALPCFCSEAKMSA